MKYVLMNLLRKFSVQADIEIIKPGYVPTGGGVIKVRVEPMVERVKPLPLLEQGKVTAIKGVGLIA